MTGCGELENQSVEDQPVFAAISSSEYAYGAVVPTLGQRIRIHRVHLLLEWYNACALWKQCHFTYLPSLGSGLRGV